MTRNRTLHRAAMIIDGATVIAAPGAILLEDNVVIAAGAPATIGDPSDAVVIDHHDAVLVPPFVNAHCHLDLSHIGPLPFDGRFSTWLAAVMERRATRNEDVACAVRLGAALSRTGGSALVGDIAGAGSLIPLQTLRHVGLPGISFIEVFGLASRQPSAIDRIARLVRTAAHDDAGVRVGLQPHAPYSCGPDVYRATADSGLPLATHLAESPEEIEFARSASGPLADLLRERGAWDDAIEPLGGHPVDALAPILARAPFLLAHLNYVEIHHIDMLARLDVHVAYCPRASAYFGHPRPGYEGHPYRAMIDAGINVALGTDSLLCLETPDRISVLDEMRLLHQRDGTDPRTLLRMATLNGAVALGADPSAFTLEPGPVAGLLALRSNAPNHDPTLHHALLGTEPPEWLLGPLPDPTPGHAATTTRPDDD